jgi:putative ABC transport system permease protein
VAMATIAVGIGAATAVFSVVDPLLFRPLPYPRDEQLVSVGYFGPVDNNEFNVVSSYLDWRRLQTPFQAITSMQPRTAACDLDTGTIPRRVDCQYVESNFLHTLGLAPELGRDFTPDDDRRGAPLVALISDELWSAAFGRDRRALERTVLLDEQPVRIVGVLPKNFEMPQLGPADILVPEQLRVGVPRSENSSGFLRTFARLREGVTIRQAYQAMLPLYEDSLRKDVPAELRSMK